VVVIVLVEEEVLELLEELVVEEGT